VGGAIAYGLHTIKPILSSVRAVNQFTAFPVLGVVSVAFPTAQRKKMWRHVWRISAASACLVIALGIVLLLNWSGARLGIHAIQSMVNI
jgi:energy-converting hydrogenase Eha subunit A